MLQVHTKLARVGPVVEAKDEFLRLCKERDKLLDIWLGKGLPEEQTAMARFLAFGERSPDIPVKVVTIQQRIWELIDVIDVDLGNQREPRA